MTYTYTEVSVYLVQECNFETVPLTVAYAYEDLAKEHAKRLALKKSEAGETNLHWYQAESVDEYGKIGAWYTLGIKYGYESRFFQYEVLRYPVKYELFMEAAGGE